MRTAVVIALKDLRLALRDRSAIAVSLIAPLGLALILSSVLGGGVDSLRLQFAFATADSGELAQTFREDVLGAIPASLAEVVDAESPAAARRMARAGDVSAAVIVPAGFSAAVTAGRDAVVEVTPNPDAEIGPGVAEAIADRFAAEINATSLAIGTVTAATGVPPPNLDEFIADVRAKPPPVVVESAVAGSREFQGKTFFAAGMAVFFLFFTAQTGAVSLLRERHGGTLNRLLASPASRRAVVGGKALFSYLLGLVSMIAMIGASRVLMDASWGHPVGIALLVAAGVFAATGIQSLIATLAKTDEQAAGYGSIVGVTLGLLGGTFFPLSQAPGIIARVSGISPHALMMRGFGELSGGIAGPADVLGPVGGLVAIGVVFGALALLRSDRLVAAS